MLRVTVTNLSLSDSTLFITRSLTMPPSGSNTKKESGKAKKAENQAKKAEAAAADKVCTRSPMYPDATDDF